MFSSQWKLPTFKSHLFDIWFDSSVWYKCSNLEKLSRKRATVVCLRVFLDLFSKAPNYLQTFIWTVTQAAASWCSSIPWRDDVHSRNGSNREELSLSLVIKLVENHIRNVPSLFKIDREGRRRKSFDSKFFFFFFYYISLDFLLFCEPLCVVYCWPSRIWKKMIRPRT